MAGANPNSGAEPTVTLTADTAPFEQALEQAADKVSGWGSRIEQRFSRISDGIRSRTSKIVGAVDSVTEKLADGMDVAGAIGSTIGGALGGVSIAGFSLGATGQRIGAQLGESITRSLADGLDFADALLTGGGLKDGIKQTVADAADAWDGLKFSAAERFKEIRDIVLELNLADLIRSDADSAAQKLEDVFGRIGDKIALLLAQGIARAVDFVNAAFDRIKEPVAQVADFFQAIGERLGLVDAGTANWADSIRGLEKAGEKAFLALGRGIGYVEGAIIRTGAIIVKNLQQPIADALTFILGRTREMLEFVGTMPGKIGREANEKAKSLGLIEGRIKDISVKTEALANKALEKSIDDFAKDREAGFARFLAAGNKQNAADDARRKADQDVAGAKEPPKPQVDPMKSVRAMLGGSSEATQAVIAAQRSTMGAMGPQERVAKGVDGLNQKAAEQIQKLDVIGKGLEKLASAIETEGSL